MELLEQRHRVQPQEALSAALVEEAYSSQQVVVQAGMAAMGELLLDLRQETCQAALFGMGELLQLVALEAQGLLDQVAEWALVLGLTILGCNIQLKLSINPLLLGEWA
jgi:hypothetical protein